MSLELILPLLQPIAPLLTDPDVSEIMVNGGQQVFVERCGELQQVPAVTLDERHMLIAIKTIARLLGDDVSNERPVLDARLPDGSRVAVVLPPCSVDGPTLTIRKFRARRWTSEELVGTGMLTNDMVARVAGTLASGGHILVSGGTSTGKTTLLNAFVGLLPWSSRIVLVEDTAELVVSQPNVVRLEARRTQPDAPAITIRDLVRASLRHCPDHLIVGEVRGAEAIDLLQALNTGHGASLCTIRANSATEALTRLATSALQSEVALPYRVVRRLVRQSIAFVVHLDRQQGKRCVTEMLSVSSTTRSQQGVCSRNGRARPSPGSPADP